VLFLCYFVAADADCVALLCAQGALRQKPRAQHFGPFLQHFMPRLQALAVDQLVNVLAAMAHLQLTTTDTQVVGAPGWDTLLFCLSEHVGIGVVVQGVVVGCVHS
jgi:hypothetical protein